MEGNERLASGCSIVIVRRRADLDHDTIRANTHEVNVWSTSANTHLYRNAGLLQTLMRGANFARRGQNESKVKVRRIRRPFAGGAVASGARSPICPRVDGAC